MRVLHWSCLPSHPAANPVDSLTLRDQAGAISYQNGRSE
jgi:hypothetical protein